MKPYAHIDDEGIRQHHGNITQLDHAFGIVMQGLDDLGLRDNTMVFFTSDNGPEGKIERGRTQGSTGGLRGRKRDSHEGGIRVAGMVRWPGQVVPGQVVPGLVDPVLADPVLADPGQACRCAVYSATPHKLV